MRAASDAQTIQRSSISAQAESYLRGMILEGTLSPGDRLNEVALAEAIGISRGPLREAIKRLSGQGYLTMEAHRGAYVRSYSPREIVDLYELRSALELFAIRLAVERASTADLEALNEQLKAEKARIRAHAAGEHSEPYVAELDFHQQLVALGANAAINEQLQDANHKLFLALRSTSRSERRREQSAADHAVILERVMARDVDGSVSLLTGHLMDSMSNSLSVLGLEQSPETPSERTQHERKL
ncbi:GntR family transcriptional regulator [Leucobacter sp. USHLN153]|uniref:GntR family transcriptional regulator n=1 Tax=Leucobacter sp. USHLN153 TaxID=3081268 RepID=UPI00301B13F2